jgi:hypothetical protein
MQKTKEKFGLTLRLHIIFLTLCISSLFASTFFPFFPSPYNVQQAIASTNVESNAIIPNKINFTSSDVSILYSANWKAVSGTFRSEDMNSIITFRLLPENDTDNSLAILNVAKRELGSGNTTIGQYANLQLFLLRGTISDFELIQYNNTITLSGRPAYQIVYSGLEGTGETKTMKLGVIDHLPSFGTTVYTITYSAKPENYDIHLASALDIINSFIIRDKFARAPQADILEAELLEYIPRPSIQELRNIANLTGLKFILGDHVTSLLDFIKGSSNMPPPNFSRLPTLPNDSMSIHYHLSPAYFNPTNNSIYAILVLIFTDNTSNRVLIEPIDYKVNISGINGTNFSFEKEGNTSTGLDMKILSGTSLGEALKNSQEYKLGVDVSNVSRISFKQTSEIAIAATSLNKIR